MEEGAARLKRLRWNCRRGMKELDMLLEDFIRREEAVLADGGWPGFEALLACEDDRLWDWFQGRTDEDSARHQELIDAIRRRV